MLESKKLKERRTKAKCVPQQMHTGDFFVCGGPLSASRVSTDN